MTTIKIARLISASSEDPKHPATNLLKLEGTGCWKCKEPGVKNAILIFELSEDSVINSVDVGNENSALIEVLVAKSADPDNFQVLVIATSLMTVQESRNGFNKNSVKFFKYEQLMKPTADGSWNRVKIICSQPFNSSVQYGLSFIKFHSKSVVNKPVTNNITLGRYRLKTENESDINIGSLFLKRKDPLLSLSVDVTTNNVSSSTTPPLSDKKPPESPKSVNNHHQGSAKKRKADPPNESLINVRKAIGGPLLYVNDEDNENANESLKSPGATLSSVTTANKKNDALKMNTVSTNDASRRKSNVNSASTSSAASNDRLSSSKTNNSKPGSDKLIKRTRNVPKRKPFNKLFENVVIVMSGYQNPYRSTLRSKAVQMGARYKADWDHTCTHLLCAFMNTPKYHQVRGKGHIVTKDWIEDSYNQRKKLSWKRYALNKNDVKDTDSDEEILEASSASDDSTDSDHVDNDNNRQNITKNSDEKYETDINEDRLSDSDTEDEIERVKLRQRNNIKSTLGKSVYDLDTDVDDEESDIPSSKNGNNANSSRVYIQNDEVPGTSKNNIPFIPEFFGGLIFYVDCDLSEKNKQLRRYIIAHSGNITDNITRADYVISEKSTLKNNENYKVVNPQWILDCHDCSKVLPVP